MCWALVMLFLYSLHSLLSKPFHQCNYDQVFGWNSNFDCTVKYSKHIVWIFWSSKSDGRNGFFCNICSGKKNWSKSLKLSLLSTMQKFLPNSTLSKKNFNFAYQKAFQLPLQESHRLKQAEYTHPHYTFWKSQLALKTQLLSFAKNFCQFLIIISKKPFLMSAYLITFITFIIKTCIIGIMRVIDWMHSNLNRRKK